MQGVPPRFAAGAYRVKEVDFTDSRLPSVTIPEPPVDAMPMPPQAVSGAPPAEDSAFAQVDGEPIVARPEAFRDVLSQAANAARDE